MSSPSVLCALGKQKHTIASYVPMVVRTSTSDAAPGLCTKRARASRATISSRIWASDGLASESMRCSGVVAVSALYADEISVPLVAFLCLENCAGERACLT